MRTWLRALVRLPRRQRARSAPKPAKPAGLRVEQLETLLLLSVAPSDPGYAEWSQQTFSIADIAPALTDGYADLGTTPVEGLDAAARALIGANAAQVLPYTGQGYTIAIIDSGVDYRHSALAGDYLGGWDFVDNDADPMDLNGHGTHVAGIITGSDAQYLGIAPDVKFVALRVLDETGTGTYGNVLSALQWVERYRTQYNIVAVNLSLGSGNFTVNPYSFLEGTLAQLKNQGVFVAAASGNSFYSNNSQPGLGYPAISQYVVSVGAVWDANYGPVAWGNGGRDFSTAADRITSFTQRSAQLDLLAPGAFITSTYLNNTYTAMAGTSMASPVVAAAAVIVHQALDAAGQSARATPDGILAILKATGQTIVDGDDEHDNVVNTGLSFKRVDLAAAVEYAQSSGDRAYVNSLYVSLLGRNADSAGLNHFSGLLRSGAARSDVVQAIWNSTEHLGKVVDGLYAQYLHRSADAGGRSGWIAAIREGRTIDEVARAIVNSAEYSTRNASNGAFVDSLYREILGREADAGGRASWVNQLNGGTSRANVASAFLRSTEYVDRAINSLYQNVYGRRADQGSLQYYRSQVQNGQQSLASITQSLLASVDYFGQA
ncbi:MAG: DUF4214 domain-containing protein [Planctomycetaceae bacterium]|nr:DUF4214 domain-containing protein [Planctomycetaceae bacterium]